jgi:hypothetical protein
VWASEDWRERVGGRASYWCTHIRDMAVISFVFYVVRGRVIFL